MGSIDARAIWGATGAGGNSKACCCWSCCFCEGGGEEGRRGGGEHRHGVRVRSGSGVVVVVAVCGYDGCR